ATLSCCARTAQRYCFFARRVRTRPLAVAAMPAPAITAPITAMVAAMIAATPDAKVQVHRGTDIGGSRRRVHDTAVIAIIGWRGGVDGATAQGGNSSQGHQKLPCARREVSFHDKD